MSETDTHPENDNCVTSTTESAQKEAERSVTPTTRNTLPKQETQPENVNDVLAKAKKASVFLWTLLHAQVCSTPDNQCIHKGCAEAKRILQHIKWCPSNAEFPCPSSHNGCQQSRKLLSHYRKCREIRSRQRRQGRAAQTTEACLICTLLARHDKTISQNALSITSPIAQLPSSSQKRNNQTNSLSTSFEKIYSPQVSRRKPRSKSVQFDLSHESKTSDTPQSMPPPAPRTRTYSVGSIGSVDSYDKLFSARRYTTGKENRPRAGSLDESKMPSPSYENDPTVEIEITSPSSTDEISLTEVEKQLPFRKRSVSCSLMTSHEGSKGCDTIMEE